MENKVVFIVVLDVSRSGFGFHWAMGSSLQEARKEYRKVAGYFPTTKAKIVAVECNEGGLPYVNDMAEIHLPTGSKVIQIN